MVIKWYNDLCHQWVTTEPDSLNTVPHGQVDTLVSRYGANISAMTANTSAFVLELISPSL